MLYGASGDYGIDYTVDKEYAYFEFCCDDLGLHSTET